MMSFPFPDFIISTKLVILLYFLSFLIPCFPLFSSASSSAMLHGNETDYISLVEFKKMIKDDPFGVVTSWNETIHFCEWPGVSCGRRHRRVTAIRLRSRRLVGSVPPHIGNLSFLRELDLDNNFFSGVIPPEIRHLRRLQILYVSNNSFNGFIPSNISACKNLKAIDFMRNNLIGNIPEELGTLTNLLRVRFTHNNLTGKIPHSFGNLSLLLEFHADENNLGGEIPDSLCRLPRLQMFVVYQNNLSGTLPPPLFNHSTMMAIELGTNNIKGTLPSNLFITLPLLYYFSIAQNNFTGSIPVTLSNATNLVIIYLDANGLTGKVPNLWNLQKLKRFEVAKNSVGKGEVGDLNFLSSLVNSTSLEILELGYNNFGGFLPESISNLSQNLVSLGLSNNQVSGNVLGAISNLNSLFSLFLSNNKFSGEIPPEIGLLNNLQGLDLSGNNVIGKIPPSFGNLTHLTRLSLRENYLQESIPPSLGKCQNLELLYLSRNNLSGFIPKEVFLLSSLIRLDLSNNKFTGSISKDVRELKNIGYLDLSCNSLSGRIPMELGSCVLLDTLDLSNNNLQGTIPSVMKNLRGLQFLEFSHNNLTGEIPAFLKDFKFLENLNLSYNDFEGALPSTGIFNNTSTFSIVGNKKLCGGIPELKLPECNTTKPKKKKSKAYLKIVIPLIFGILVLALALFILWFRWLRRQRKESFLGLLGNSTLRVSYHTLFKSTNGFSSDNLLGVGGFGAVYKGTFDHDGTVFAVKVLDPFHHGVYRSFVAECEVLKNTRHRNLVKVLTACSGVDLQGNEFMAIVYEYMDNGNLENWLHFSPQIQDNKRLSCFQRLNILIDVACALDYLHNDCEPAIIHCDLKPSNVLLDKNMTAHVSDFGLARFVQRRIQNSSESQSYSLVRGTIGYAPPEYGVGTKPKRLGDVYSFGILILEMFTGRKPTDELFNDGLNLHIFAKAALPDKVIEIADPNILPERDEHLRIRNRSKPDSKIDNFQVCLASIIKIGVACSTESPSERMNIRDVVRDLNKTKKSLLV